MTRGERGFFRILFLCLFLSSLFWIAVGVTTVTLFLTTH